VELSTGPLVGIADDLSGAAETAQLLGGRGSVVVLDPAGLDEARTHPAVAIVVDLDTRYLTPSAAARRVADVVSALPAEARLLKKVDSLLRGNVAAELGALAEAGRTVLLAPALPELGRSVAGGVPLVHGVPLAESGLWRTETAQPPARVADLFATEAVASIALDTVRSEPDALRRAIVDAAASARIVVVDAESDHDLDRLVFAAASTARNDLVLAGSRALGAALGRSGGPARRGEDAAPDALGGTPGTPGTPGTRHPDPLVVVGSADAAAHRQFEHLARTGVATITVDPRLLLDGAFSATAVASLVAAGGPSALRLAPSTAIDPAEARRLAGLLAALVGEGLERADAGRPAPRPLVILGGETARALMAALGVTRIRLTGAIGRHAVASSTPDGRLVVTRPGSFGPDGDLVHLVGRLAGERTPPPSSAAVPPSTVGSHDSPALRSANQEGTSMTQASTPTTGLTAGSATDPRPVIAVTMGDGAGVGPEVIVAALAEPAVYEGSRPVVIGDAVRLREAVAIRGLDLEVVPIDAIADAVSAPGRIDVIDLALLPADLPWGRLSAVAGDAAFQYVREACRLAVAGEVDAICTAPLNKEALHEGGHAFPGHTELLAALTGTEEVSMMLSTPVVKVIHVTTHVGLIDAVARIEPGLVERTIRRGHSAMRGAGIAEPRIGVCAINPHAGEHGLFGYGEEETKIAPGIEAARADGIDARGPLPADTAFFLAGRGDYDLIVAMYHDQGHGPVKVLGIEAGTNITVGLPVIRTSVDHGTAFDIAGTGVADARSMTEAIRQAAQLSVGAAQQAGTAA
jgi:4-hydroxythreonine-4-phosphate dehydrogenase